MNMQLDNYDLEILRILQEDNTLTEKFISEKVNLSPTSVHRRIHKMRANGVIIKNVAVVNPEMVQRPITLIIEISLKDVHIRSTDFAKEKILSIPQVQQCYHVTGDADFILIMVLSSMEDYTAINRSLFENNDNIKGVKTFVTLDRVKSGQALAI